jgi:hypothetical protein
MSWLSNIGKAIGKGAKDTGHFVGKVASNPIVDAGLAMIPGVGPGVAAGAAGLGRLMAPGGNIGNALKSGATGYLAGMGGSALKGALAGGGSLGSKLGALATGAKGLLGGSNATPNAAAQQGGGTAGSPGGPWGPPGEGASPAVAAAQPGNSGGFMGALGNMFKNPDGSLNMQKVLGAAGTVSGIVGQQQANKQASNYYNQRMGNAQNGINAANTDYASRAGMRSGAFSTLSGIAANGAPGSTPFRNYYQQNQPKQPAAAGGAAQSSSAAGGSY